MKRVNVEQILVFVGLVAISVALRLRFQEIPNFAPVAAVALFAGYFFESRLLAAAAPLCVMLITDSVIGGYQPALMLTVYGFLMAPVLMRGTIRRNFRTTGTVRASVYSGIGLLMCTLIASILFFTVTNFMTWIVTPWYPRTMAGLVHCYTSAIPFFRYTLAGDVCFATVLFGGYALIGARVGARRRESEPVVA